MKKPLVICFFMAFAIQILNAKQSYHRAKIYTNHTAGGIQKLIGLGIAADHGEVKEGVFIISDFSENELQLAKANGFQVEVIIPDVQGHYIMQEAIGTSHGRNTCNKPEKSYPTPQNFSLGSMGGYFTFQEMKDILDDMAAKYPNLITEKQAIGYSIEGRPLYMVKISNNANVDENEPEVFYNALHHAREPASLSQLIFFMWHLLENYATNQEVKYLLDNLEMYFVPCINPDGYVYNHLNYPTGGGMWRKNRRNNGDNSYGVDLNRNYGHAWGFDNFGSSPNTSSETYRGTSAFSEPETQAIRDFCNDRKFRLALNYHTFGNLLIYPWGYLPSYFTPDSALFVNYGQQLTKENQYKFGTGDQTVGYVVNGSSDDWMYGDEVSKDKIFSMTPEAGEGEDGFWPPQYKIEGICNSNIFQNLTLAHLALKHANVKDKSPELLPVTKTHIPFSITCTGLESPANFTVSLTPLKNITAPSPAKTFSSMALMEQRVDSFAISYAPGLKLGDEIKFVLSTSNGTFSFHDTITKIFDNGMIAFADAANNMANWSSTSWNTTLSSFVSPPSSFTDSPWGNYSNYANTFIGLKQTVDLSTAKAAYLSFNAKWDIEANYDYVQVLASSDGIKWEPLCGNHTRESNINTIYGQPVYDGVQPTWVEETINLEEYLGTEVSFRFRLRSDEYVTRDGFYFDDFKVTILPLLNNISENSNYTSFVNAQPNPASDYAYISYLLPAGTSEALLKITDLNGRTVKSQNLEPDNNRVLLQTSGLQQGIYLYTIEAEGILLPVKKLVVVNGNR